MPVAEILRFFVARGLPAVLGVLALVIFTRLLTPDQFGVYSVTLASANVATAALFYWLALAVVRFGVETAPERAQHLNAVLWLYLLCVTASCVGFGVFAMTRSGLNTPLILGGLFVLAESWFQLNQKLAIAQIQPRRFAFMTSAKTAVGLAAGSIAIWLGLGANGALAGTILGSLVGGIAAGSRAWSVEDLRSVSRRHILIVLRYGTPLGVTIALGYLLGTVDRLLLAHYDGHAQAGVYAAGYDLAYSGITLVLTTVNMVVYPHLLNAAESVDALERRSRFKNSLDLLLVVSLPLLIAIVLLSSNIARLLLGGAFSEAAARVMPWIACSTFIGGIRSYYLDVSFHLARDSRSILFIVATISLVNAALNALLIPRWHIDGALFALIVAQCVGFLLSALLGRRAVDRAPAPDRETRKISIAAIVAVVATWPFSYFEGLAWLLCQLVILGVAYCGTLGSLRARVFLELAALVGRAPAPHRINNR